MIILRPYKKGTREIQPTPDLMTDAKTLFTGSKVWISHLNLKGKVLTFFPRYRGFCCIQILTEDGQKSKNVNVILEEEFK